MGWALSHAVAGEIIEIEPGTYLESAAPDVAVHTANIVNMAGLTIEPDAALGGSAANTIINATGEQYGLAIVADDVTVTGLTIEHAGASGVIVAPTAAENPSYAGPPVSVTGDTLSHLVVTDNDLCNNTPTAAFCPPPSPESDFGEGVHLLSVADSTVSNSTVSGDFGGVLVTDEVGPNHGNLISDNTVSGNFG